MPPSRSRPKAERVGAERAGHRGEALAALFLRTKLYGIRERRYRTPVGELDIVAERGGTLVFVEVKARAYSSGEAEALAAVDRRRIVRAALHYLARHPRLAQRAMRFDVIFVAPFAWPRHVIDAFDTTGIA